MRKFGLLLTCIGLLSGLQSFGQYQINAVNTPQTIDFTSYEGTGVVPVPSAGELDSDDWRVVLSSETPLIFGGSSTAPAFGNGKTPAPVQDSGVYAFETSGAPINVALGAKLDATIDSATFTLRIENNTGITVNTIALGFDWGAYNSTDGSVKGAFSYSSDDVVYTPGGNNQFSDTLFTPTPAWTGGNERITLNNLAWAPGSYYYLKWSFTADFPVAGLDFDEVALDAIEITATVPVLSFTTTAVSDDESNDLMVTVHCDYSDINETAVALDLGAARTATQGLDFTYALADTAKFVGANAPDVSFTIPVNDDIISEADETFLLYLNNASNGAQLDAAMDTVTLTIEDNDKIRLSFETLTSSVAENSATVHKVVGKVENNADSTTVLVSLISGTASDGVDYSWAGQKLGNKFEFVGTGTLTDTLEFTVIDDVISEGDETAKFELSNPDNGLSLTVEIDPAKDSHEVTITDDEIPQVSFELANHTINETAGSIKVNVTRTDAGSSPTDITVGLVGTGTATEGADFMYGTEVTLTFAGGEGETQNVLIPITDDAIIEGDEFFVLELKSPVNATLGLVNDTVTILDNDSPELNFREVNIVQTEGFQAEVVVELLAPHPSQAVSCEIRRTGGTATQGVDFVDPFPITLTFPAGNNTPQTIQVSLIDDAIVEPTEFIDLEIAAPQNGTVGIDKRASINIEDNDNPEVEFVVIDQNVFEGDGTAKVIVALSQPNATQDVEVDVMLAGGSATEGQDFDYPVVQRIVFPAGTNANQQILVDIIDDNIPEPNEAFTLALKNPTAGVTLGAKETHSITIFDNDQTQVTFSFSSDDVNEDVGTTDVTVEVINPSASVPTTVDVVLGNGTATEGADFQFSPTTLTFNAGDGNPKVITIPVIDDTNRENTETAILELDNVSSNAIVGQRRFTLNIADNDTSSVQFVNATQATSEGDPRIFVAVEILNASDDVATDVRIDLAAGGTATEGQDFNFPSSQTVRFLPGGSNIETIAIPLFEDTDYEGDETFELSLVSLDPSVKVAQGSQIDTIIDNEADPTPILGFQSSAVGVDEGAGYIDVNVEISVAMQDTVGVDVVLLPGSATEGVDFSYASTQHLIFPRNSTAPQALRIPITEDFVAEGNEDFTLQLMNPTNGAILSGGNDTISQITIQDNDTIQGAYITFNTGYLEVDESTLNPVVEMILVDDATCIVQTTVVEDGATNLIDFTGGQGTRVFTATTANQALTLLTIIDDIMVEETESFIIYMEITSGPCIKGPYDSVRVVINDNDGGSGVQFDYDTFTVTEIEDTIRLGVVVDTTFLLNCEVDVMLKVGESTADIADDYDYPAAAHLVFNGNQDSLQYFDLILHDDLILEPTETVVFVLENPTGALGCVIGERDSLTVFIQDDEVPVKEYTIGEINGVDNNGFADSLGVECEIRGVVHGHNLSAARYSFFFLDGTGSILVTGPFLPAYSNISEGDSLRLFGTVEELNGMLHFRPQEVEMQGAGTLQMHTVLNAVPGELEQGFPVIINCIKLDDIAAWSGSNFVVSATGDIGTVEIQINDQTLFDPTTAPQGKFNLKGYVMQDDNTLPYTGNYRVIPMELDDVDDVLFVDFDFIVTGDFVDFDGITDNGVTVSWDFGDGVGTADELKAGYTYDDAGFYTVTLTVTDANGCSVTISKEIEVEDEIIIVGVEAPKMNKADVRIFPNPFADKISLNTKAKTLELFGIDGKVVSRGVGSELRTGHLPGGVYILRITLENGDQLNEELIKF